MSQAITSPNILISSVSQFVPQQSDADSERFVFAYTITIENKSNSSYQLISRHWVIQDANMKTEEVFGEGVVGERPIIEPGSSYTYTSGAVLETDIGTMEGRYFFVEKESDSDVTKFEVLIPKFLLTVPRTIH